MENLNGTVIATALPQMARSFSVAPVDLSFGMSAYLLTLAVFIPISGWAADRIGSRTVFASAIAVFTASSLLCALSDGLWSFTAARVAQGIGGAMMVPVGRLVVLRATEKANLMRAIATITWPGLVAPILGPPLGGFITEYANWRWIFLLNLPLGLIGLGLSFWLIPNRRETNGRPFDSVGFVLSGTACVAVVYGMELVGQRSANLLWAACSIGVGVLLAIAAVWHMRRGEHPLLDVGAARIQTYAMSIRSGSLFRIVIHTVPFLLPLMFQVGFGLDPFASGLLILAVFSGNLAIKPATSFILRRFGFRTVLIGNGLLMAGSLMGCAMLWPDTPVWVIAIVLFWGGVCRSMQFTALATLAFADISKARMSGANTLSSVAQQLTMGMGIAAGAMTLRFAGMLHPGDNGVSVMDFHVAFFIIAATALVALPEAWRLPEDAGASVSGHIGKRLATT